MRLVKNILIFLIVFYISFIAFMPKKEIYFYGEKLLNKNGVIIYNEKFKEAPINLTISNGIVSYQGVDVASFNKIDFKPLLFINSITAQNIKFLNLAKKALNIEIENLQLKESILKPLIIDIIAKGSFGDAKGYIDLKNRVIHIDIINAQDIVSIKKFLQKGAKGWYYESKF